MRIRQKHPILDRVKVIFVLVALLCILCTLAQHLEKNEKTSTIERLLQVAMEPVGKTMYIWGGGWNDEDSAAGAGSAQIGVSDEWEKFAEKQDENYDYTNYRFEREKGLDCSGYVGWVLYNVFETKEGGEGYVTISTDMAKNLSDRGWGEYIENPTEFLPGDIVSMDGHVWISLGTCEDGSVLLVHSSPPGVSVCGTQIPRENQTEGYDGMSIAIELATIFMEEHYPEWQKKYPNRATLAEYLENVSLMRWNNTTMKDAEEWQKKKGEEVMALLQEVSRN